LLTDLKKAHSKNLERRFTVSVTAHSISILSELKMSFPGPYASERLAVHQLRYQLHSIEGRVKCHRVPQLRELDKAVNK